MEKRFAAHAASTEAGIQIIPRKPGGSRLVQDYLRGEASSFYDGSYRDLNAYRQRLASVTERFGPAERQRAAEALRPTSARARERLERFVHEGGAVVTTGQQAGFLTGPLYTIYKALTVVRLAEDLERRLGIIVLPVFWTASEDHDWAEVDHAYLGTRTGVRRVQLPSGTAGALQMSDRRLGDGLESTLSEAADILSLQGDSERCMKLILDAYQPRATVAGAFSRLLAELLEPFDLLLTDAADPALKRASLPVLRRSLERAGAEEAALRERGAALRNARYPEQVAVLEGGTNVFYSGSGERERLYRRGEDFIAAGSGARYRRNELLEELERRPDLFSPNVLLRPVVESAVFPTLAYVGGPGEMAYFAQLGVLFPMHGMRTPVVYPRYGATLVEGRVKRDLERTSLSLADLELPRHVLVESMARAALPPSVADRAARLGDAIAAGYRELIKAAEEIDPTLRGALGALRNESLARLGRSERKILRALKRREADAIERLDRVRDAIYPQGAPQERVLNVMPFLVREPRLLERIAASINGWIEAKAEGMSETDEPQCPEPGSISSSSQSGES